MNDIVVFTSVARLTFTREQATELLDWMRRFPGKFPQQSIGPYARRENPAR